MRNPNTTADIEAQLKELNHLLARPEKPYVRNADGRFVAQLGNIHLYHDHYGYKLHEVRTEGGGVRDVTYKWLKTKKDVCVWLDGAIYSAREKLASLV